MLPILLFHDGRPNSCLRRVHRAFVQYGCNTVVYLPGVAPGSRRMIQQIEDQHLALPDRLALEFLTDANSLAHR